MFPHLCFHFHFTATRFHEIVVQTQAQAGFQPNGFQPPAWVLNRQAYRENRPLSLFAFYFNFAAMSFNDIVAK